MSAFLLASTLAITTPPEPISPDERAESVDTTDPTTEEETPPPEPAVVGCAKDTDCKGDRICDAATRQCQDPTPAPAPVVQARDPSPPTWYRSAPPRMHHPYVAGGVTMIVLGVAGVSIGGAWLGVYKGKLDQAADDVNSMLAWENNSKTERYADVSARGPKVYAGTGILISSGAVLFVTGIILAAIKEPVRVAVEPGGLTLRF